MCAALVDDKARTDRGVRVATVSSPSKFPFADSCLFLEDTLYLFQCKGTAAAFDWNAGDDAVFITNCAMMGLAVSRVANTVDQDRLVGHEGFVPCDANTLPPAARALCEASESIVDGLKAIWKDATGLEIAKVVRCFVTPHGHTFGTHCGGSAVADSSKFYKDTSGPRGQHEVIFVSTQDVSFLQYFSRGPPADAAASIVTNQVSQGAPPRTDC